MGKICIVGGGASGLAAAITIKEKNRDAEVYILEKKEMIGKKLLATGNGRCNIANTEYPQYDAVSNFLENCGIATVKEAEGRMYPMSMQAQSVVKLLSARIQSSGIRVITEAEVKTVNVIKDTAGVDRNKFEVQFTEKSKKKTMVADCVILSCGGKAAPQFGTTGDGYSLAKSFGHSISKIRPILMPVTCKRINSELKGVRQKARVSLIKENKIISEETGEVQFTSDGLSGICIFNLTGHINIDKKNDETFEQAFEHYTVALDFLPDMELRDVEALLSKREEKFNNLPREYIFMSLVNDKIGKEICRKARNMNKKQNIDIKQSAVLLKDWKYTLTGAKGWKEAQCTAGGVKYDEINKATMESKIVEGLYFTGEILDYGGPCGGYNLSHAWHTGVKAGEHIGTKY